jgi:hypothetical protein
MDIVGLILFAALVVWCGYLLASHGALMGVGLLVRLLGPIGWAAALFIVMRRWRSDGSQGELGRRMRDFGTPLLVAVMAGLKGVTGLLLALDQPRPRWRLAQPRVVGGIRPVGSLRLYRFLKWRSSRGKLP